MRRFHRAPLGIACVGLLAFVALTCLRIQANNNTAVAADNQSLLSKMGTSTTNFFKGLFGGGSTKSSSNTTPTPTGKLSGQNKPTGVTGSSKTHANSTGAVGNVPGSATTGYSGTGMNTGYSKSNNNIGYGTNRPVGYSAQP